MTIASENALLSRRTPSPLVLIADADPDTRTMYAASCSAELYDVIEAGDGRDALVKALVRVPSLVLTELRLPLVDGLALCRTLREDRLTTAVPIVVVTSETRPAETDRAIRLGANAVLTKPARLDALMAEVRRQLVLSADLRARSSEARAIAAARIQKSADLLIRSSIHRRPMLSRAFQRATTTTPVNAAPELRCPRCDHALRYDRSYIGGVNAQQAEQWDYFECPSGCGLFQYRHRTRKLRQCSAPPGRAS